MNNEIDLWSLLKFYGKYWYVILIFVLLGTGVGAVYNIFIQTPVYQSDTKVTFINEKTGATARTVRDISNYADLVKSRTVLNSAIDSSKEDITYDQLASATTVKNDKNTDVINITVVTPNPYRSAALASGITSAFVDNVISVYNVPKDEVRVIDSAQRIDTPVNVRKNLQLILAAGIGFVLALIVLFFALDFKNTRTTDDEDEEELPMRPVAPKPRAPQSQPRIARQTVPEDSMDLPEEFYKDLPKTARRVAPASPKKPGASYRKVVK